MNYESRVIALMVAPEGTPMFEQDVITVKLDDEAGGEFVILSQNTSDGTAQISIEPNAWPTLREAIDRMMKECRA